MFSLSVKDFEAFSASLLPPVLGFFFAAAEKYSSRASSAVTVRLAEPKPSFVSSSCGSLSSVEEETSPKYGSLSVFFSSLDSTVPLPYAAYIRASEASGAALFFAMNVVATGMLTQMRITAAAAAYRTVLIEKMLFFFFSARSKIA